MRNGAMGAKHHFDPLKLWRGASATIAALAAVLMLAPAASAQPDVTASILHKGNAIVTGFSGTAPAAAPAPSGDPIDSLFIDLNGASMRLQDISAGGQPPQGQLIASPTTFQAKAGDVGQVFGIAMDDGRGPDGNLSVTPDIYLSATSAFGLQIVRPDATGALLRMRTGNPRAQWMPGQWGDAAKGATPGSIWKVNGTTGAITLFANVTLNGQANSGPSLGNITFHAKSRQIFVSDLLTGMIHRIDMHGTDLGHFDHGVQGRVGQGLAPIPDDPANRLDIANPLFSSDDAASWHYATKGRMVWALRAHGDRLFYATAEGPQVWSVSIAEDGSFGNDARLEIDVTGTPNNNAISDMVFDGEGYLYLAQRGAARGDYTYKVFAEGKKSALLRYHQDPQTGKWQPAPEEYAVGFPPEHRNTNGGVALGYGYDSDGRMLPGACGRMLWTTGELLRQGSGLPGPEIVHGLQGMDRSLVRPANVPPKQSYFTDYDGSFNDADAAGHMGNVKIWQPCEQQTYLPLVPGIPPIYTPPPTGTFNLTLTKIADPKDCVIGGIGYHCSFRIFVTNTGTTVYSGPLVVNDILPTAPAGAIMTFSPQPPWVCTPATPTAYSCVDPSVTMLPGQAVELDVVVELPRTYRDCYLPNAAALEWPNGYHDANPNDDTGFATAKVPNQECQPPHGKKSNLLIRKVPLGYCKRDQTGWLCNYIVVVTNIGPDIYNDKIVVTDTVPAGATATFSSPFPWACAGGPPAYQCVLPPAPLNVSQVTGFLVHMHVPASDLKPEMCKVPNKVHIAYAPGGSDENTNPADDDDMATALIPTDRCLGKQTNLKIEKERFEDCYVTALHGGSGQVCLFQIRVTNTGPGVYSGPIVFHDDFEGPVTLSVVAGTGSGSPWTCSNGPNSVCQYPNATLAPNDVEHLLAAGFIPDSEIARGKCSMKNTVKIVTAVPGSPQNSNPNDDTATATQTVNDPRCKQTPPPPPPATNASLKIYKSAGDCNPQGNAGDYDCGFTIEIKNTGASKFSGKLEFDDLVDTKYGTAKFDSAWSCTTGAKPWHCSTSTSIDPNKSAVAYETLHIAHGDLAATSCAVKNTVTIVTPSGVLPPDNSASATDYMYNEPKCIPAPPPPQTPPPVGLKSPRDGHVTILKSCAPSAIGSAGIVCKITVKNDGGEPLVGSVTFGDKGIWKGDNSPLSFASATPDDATVQCSGLPNAVTCTLPASALPPGGSHTVTVVVKPGNQPTYHNCAMVMGEGGKPIGTPACVDGGNDITVKKTGPASCKPGQDCTFQVSLSNTSGSDFSGPLDLADLMAIGGQKTAATITSITPPLGCNPAPSTLPLACKANVSLAAGETQKHTVTVRMPQLPEGAKGTVNGYNCFVAVGDSRSDAGLPRSGALKPDQSPGDGAGYSCVSFTVETAQDTCPGQLVRTNGDCKCPEGSKQFANYQCKGNTDTPPVITKTCERPLVGTPGNCHCPSDKPNFVNGKCLPNDVKHCPRGKVFIDGACVTPQPEPCQPPLVGTPPNCHPPIVTQCPPNTEGVFPFCKPIQHNQCPRPGEVKVDGKHCCPRGSVWDGKCYPPSNGGTGQPGNGGDTPPKCTGIMIKGVCLGQKGGVSTVPQNQLCKRGTKWNGRSCAPIGQDGPLQSAPSQNAPGIFLKQLLVPNGNLGPKIN